MRQSGDSPQRTGDRRSKAGPAAMALATALLFVSTAALAYQHFAWDWLYGLERARHPQLNLALIAMFLVGLRQSFILLVRNFLD